MNPLESFSEQESSLLPPLLAVMAGKRVDPAPMWLMRQAGRWLPEYRALRTQAPNFVDFCLNPDLAAEATLQPLARWPLDAAIVFSDILLIPHALGMTLTFTPGEGPKLAPALTTRNLDAWDWDGFLDKLAPVEATLRRVRGSLPPSVAVLGFCGAPWTVALYMLAGRGGDAARREAREAAWRDPGFMAALLERLADASGRWLARQLDAGADAVQIFDSWSGEIPFTQARAWREAPLGQTIATLRGLRPDAPVIAFLRGVDAPGACQSAVRAGANMVSLDYAADLDFLATEPATLPIQGALDPLALVVGGKVLETAARACLAALATRPHVFNLGHGVVPHTPPEHGAQLVDIVKNYTKR